MCVYRTLVSVIRLFFIYRSGSRTETFLLKEAKRQEEYRCEKEGMVRKKDDRKKKDRALQEKGGAKPSYQLK